MAENQEFKKRGDGRRSRSMLSTYYTAEQTVDPMDFKSPDFNADEYFEKLLKKSNLTELFQRDKEMEQEIKALDADMKSLVYENYKKFISAATTIRKMENNVDDMEQQMARLARDMQQITECSNKIEAALAPNREKILRLQEAASVGRWKQRNNAVFIKLM